MSPPTRTGCVCANAGIAKTIASTHVPNERYFFGIGPSGMLVAATPRWSSPPNAIMAKAHDNRRVLIKMVITLGLIFAGIILFGAVGVSGDTSDNDEFCAVAGIGTAGLKGSIRVVE